MSLLEEAYEPFTIMNKAVIDDGYGGVTSEWAEGATIEGAIRLDTSTEMRIAKAQGVTAAYTLTVRKDIELDYHTVIKRMSDGKIFRLLSDTDDKKTPTSAGLNMRQYVAEEFVLPS